LKSWPKQALILKPNSGNFTMLYDDIGTTFHFVSKCNFPSVQNLDQIICGLC
jgi:hypothetical protein